MKTNLNDVLHRVFCEVAERMAFLFCESPEADASCEPPPEIIGALMTFAGPLRGELRIATVPEVCREVASNVLGVEPDDEAAERASADALKELLNVTCGRILTELAGEEPVFDLSVPEVSEMSEDEWTRLGESASSILLMVDEYPIRLTLSVDEMEGAQRD